MEHDDTHTSPLVNVEEAEYQLYNNLDIENVLHSIRYGKTIWMTNEGKILFLS